MATMREFARQFKKDQEKLDALAPEGVRRLALLILRNITFSTPVKWGGARANWQTTIGAEASGTLPGPYKGAAEAQAALTRGQAVIEAYKGGSSIFLTNNLPYIVPLNEGHSAQAPAGFIEEAIAQAKAVLQDVKV